MVFAVSAHTKNVAESQYLFAIFSSIVVSCFWIFSVNAITKSDNIAKALYVIGALLGTLSGIAFYDFFLK